MLPKVVFASCNRQNLPQDYWREIYSREKPSHFVWTGDAVYTKNNHVDSLRTAYDHQLSNEAYSRFSESVLVDGVWDDHDYGVNDGGADVDGREQRQQEFLRFLDLSHNKEASRLQSQRGIHHSLDIPFGDGRSMKFIFLDTRSFRSTHYIRSLGEYKFPMSAVAAAFIRAGYSLMGYGRKYEGQVLGEAQWSWLENTLSESTADLHVIVSSIQMLTSNPVFESWGHFPTERKRLLRVLGKHNPQRTVLLSGDVHLGELSSAHYVTTDDQMHSKLVEVTSSGLTHTCADDPITKVLCPTLMKLLSKHRDAKDAYYIGRNYGAIDIAALVPHGYNITFSVKSLEPGSVGQVRLSHSVLLRDDASAASHPHDVEFADFPVMTFGLQLAVYILIFTVLVVLVKLYRKFRGIRTLRAGKRKKT